MIVLHILGIILKVIGIALLSVIGLVVLVLLLVSLVRVGADIDYIGGDLKASALVCGLKLQLYPRPPKDPTKPKKEKKPKKPKEPKPETDTEEKPKKKKPDIKSLSITFDDILGILKKVFKGVGRILTIRVDRFLLHYIAAGEDPYVTAKTFGYVNAALDALAPICRKKHPTTDVDVWTDIDFNTTKTDVDFAVSLTLRIGQIFEGIFIIIFGALGVVIKVLFRTLRDKISSKLHGGRTADTVEIEENNKDNNIQAQERMDTNG